MKTKENQNQRNAGAKQEAESKGGHRKRHLGKQQTTNKKEKQLQKKHRKKTERKTREEDNGRIRRQHRGESDTKEEPVENTRVSVLRPEGR